LRLADIVSTQGNGPFVDTSNFTQTNVPVKIPAKTGGGCVQDGPFVNMTVVFGPGPSVTANPRCLSRDFAPSLATHTLNSSLVDWTLAATSFAEYDHRIQGLGIEVEGMTLHAGGHLSVGGDIGDMGNMYSSPGDVLFYLHHANLDRLWDLWQHQDWAARKRDIAGPDTMWAYPFNFFGDVPYTNITLDTELDFQGLLGSRPADRFVKIKDVMDVRGGRFCVSYQPVPGISS
jgi:tyrosinase